MYKKLEDILNEAYRQAASGKGSKRHSTGQPFDKQPMQQINELLNSQDGCLFQAVKKIQESKRLDYPAARNELLGAINYIAGAIIFLDVHNKDVKED